MFNSKTGVAKKVAFVADKGNVFRIKQACNVSYRRAITGEKPKHKLQAV